MSKRWSNEEITLLEENYLAEGAWGIFNSKILPSRTYASIISKAHKLKISNMGLTSSQYTSRLNKYHKGTIVPLEKYINAKTKIEHECLTCNYTWKVIPTNLLKKERGCPSCSGNISGENQVTLVDSVLENVGFIRLSEYVNSNSKLLIKHKTCGEQFHRSFSSIQQGNSACAYCNQIKQIEDLDTALQDRGIRLLSTYTNTTDKVSFKHNLCGHVWVTTSASLKSGSGCPNCNRGFGWEALKKEHEQLPGFIYVLEIHTNKSAFLKIGITIHKDNRRLASVRSAVQRSGQVITSITQELKLESTRKNIVNLEFAILSKYKRFIPAAKFGGSTELKQLSDKEDIMQDIRDEIQRNN